MKDVLLSLLVGIALGAIGYGAYYDGVVAVEYKSKLQKACQGLEKADLQIKDRDRDINLLLNYCESLRAQNKELEKLVLKKGV